MELSSAAACQDGSYVAMSYAAASQREADLIEESDTGDLLSD